MYPPLEAPLFGFGAVRCTVHRSCFSPDPRLRWRQDSTRRFITEYAWLAIIRTTATHPAGLTVRGVDDIARLGDEALLSRPNEHADSQANNQFPISRLASTSTSTSTLTTMITTREVDPCESKMLHAKLQIQVVPTCADSSDYDCSSSQVNEESRKELVRRGAVGRRCAIVALPTDILSAIAEISELK